MGPVFARNVTPLYFGLSKRYQRAGQIHEGVNIPRVCTFKLRRDETRCGAREEIMARPQGAPEGRLE
jgi:hypothetical protein